MRRRAFGGFVAALVAATVLGVGGASGGATLDPIAFGTTLFTAMPEPLADPTLGPNHFTVKADEFDPGHTNLVQGTWLNAIGCPTGAVIAIPNSAFTGVAGFAPFTDPACPTGDPKDQHNEGLLLVKTGPTNNFASAVAELNGVKGITLTELGWDIRKPDSSADPRGSHCGAGAPRWNIVTSDGVVHFIGCNSPPGIPTATSNGWVRMRWPAALLAAAFPPIGAGDVVKRIQIVFDEGQDTGPDNFGGAVLDNIDVNGSITGEGPVDAD